jgi:flagellin-like hook-associated protein FlgL
MSGILTVAPCPLGYDVRNIKFGPPDAPDPDNYKSNPLYENETTYEDAMQVYQNKLKEWIDDPNSLDSRLNTIDSAMASVNDTRAKLGALENRFDYTVNSNSVASLNLAASKSRIIDLDAAKGVSDLEKARVLQEMSVYNQKNQMDMMRNQFSLLA